MPDLFKLRFGGRVGLRPSGLWHLMCVSFVAWVLLGPFLLVAAPLDVGSYTWSGRRLSGPAFLLGVPGAVTITTAFACFATWYGLYREHAWVRHVILGSISGAVAMGMLAASSDAPLAVAEWIPAVGVVLAVYWYLYRKRSVRHYFAELASRKAGA